MKTAAIYARVSSDKQKEENTIASQTAALIAFAREQNCDVPPEWVFEDDGYSGASLLRPGLERVRDLAAEGRIQILLVHAPDRLSRRYAHQVLLIEEFARAGVEVSFVRSRRATTPEDEPLLQFQGMIAEYERAQILERSRRGKRHRARQGRVNVLSGAFRISLYAQDRPLRGLLRDRRGAGAHRPLDLRTLYRGKPRHRRHHPFAQRASNSNPEGSGAVGAFDGLGDVAQSRLQGRGLLRQDADGATHAGDAAPTVARRHCLARQRQSRASPRGVDRNSRAADHRRRDVRIGRGAFAIQQEARAATHRRPQRRTGFGELREMRLRTLPHLNEVERSRHPLLSMPGI